MPFERKLVKQSLLLNSPLPIIALHPRPTTGVNQPPRTRATLSFSTQSAESGPSPDPDPVSGVGPIADLLRPVRGGAGCGKRSFNISRRAPDALPFALPFAGSRSILPKGDSDTDQC